MYQSIETISHIKEKTNLYKNKYSYVCTTNMCFVRIVSFQKIVFVAAITSIVMKKLILIFAISNFYFTLGSEITIDNTRSVKVGEGNPYPTKLNIPEPNLQDQDEISNSLEYFKKSMILLNACDRYFAESISDPQVKEFVEPRSYDFVATAYLPFKNADKADLPMDKEDLRLHYLSFAASLIRKPTREEIFACTYAQYLSFWATLYFTVSAVYWAEVHENPIISQKCFKLATYFDVYGMILSEERLFEFSLLTEFENQNRIWPFKISLDSKTMRDAHAIANVMKILFSKTAQLNSLLKSKYNDLFLPDRFQIRPVGPWSVGQADIGDTDEDVLKNSVADGQLVTSVEDSYNTPRERSNFFFITSTISDLYTMPMLFATKSYFTSALLDSSSGYSTPKHISLATFNELKRIWNEIDMFIDYTQQSYPSETVKPFAFNSNVLKILRRIEEIKIENQQIPESKIKEINTSTSFYSLKFRDPGKEGSDYEVIINDNEKLV